MTRTLPRCPLPLPPHTLQMVGRPARSDDDGGDDALLAEGGVDKRSSADKRENGFWEPFNRWWRAFHQQTNSRPKMLDFKW